MNTLLMTEPQLLGEEAEEAMIILQGFLLHVAVGGQNEHQVFYAAHKHLCASGEEKLS